ncbi:hypothetical protein [Kitasatospora sp. NPDC056531]|uniref:hypothetical protein n=1 Tax=Kitasatospora sp. NPDC056531 TaxID=3345856 RepID=UPI00367CCF58
MRVNQVIQMPGEGDGGGPGAVNPDGREWTARGRRRDEGFQAFAAARARPLHRSACLPLEAGSPVTRADPPLTPDQLEKVATDPRWKRVVAVLRDNPPQAPTAAGGALSAPSGP